MTEGAQGAGRGPVCLKNDAGGVIPELQFSPPTTWAGVKVEHCSEIALNAAAGHASPAPQMPFQPPIKLQAFSVLSFLVLCANFAANAALSLVRQRTPPRSSPISATAWPSPR